MSYYYLDTRQEFAQTYEISAYFQSDVPQFVLRNTHKAQRKDADAHVGDLVAQHFNATMGDMEKYVIIVLPWRERMPTSHYAATIYHRTFYTYEVAQHDTLRIMREPPFTPNLTLPVLVSNGKVVDVDLRPIASAAGGVFRGAVHDGTLYLFEVQ